MPTTEKNAGGKSGTRGGSREQHAMAGSQSHKNDVKKGGSSSSRSSDKR